MRKSVPHLLFAFLLTAAGCGKATDAATSKATPPAPAPSQAPPAGVHPGHVHSAAEERSASSVPVAGTGLLDRVEVLIEETDGESMSLGENAGDAGYATLSLKVKVTSRQDSPRILVEPRRFQIQTDTGRLIPAQPSSMRDPGLRSSYLKAGTSVSGWITFEVPRIANSIVLKSDLGTPPLQIPVSSPSSESDRGNVDTLTPAASP